MGAMYDDDGPIYNKRTVMGSGGGGGYSSINRPTLSTKMFMASHVIGDQHCRDGSVKLEILKNRHGKSGSANLDEAITLISNMLSNYKFQGSNELFQKSLQLKLQEAIKKVLCEDDCIPSDEAIKKYINKGE